MAVTVLALVCLLTPLSQTVLLEKAAPAVPETEGETILIRTVEELQRVLKGEPRRKTLLIADGIYTLEAPARMDKGGDVVIRSASGVSFGNPSGSTNFVEGQEHIRDSVIRNNVIVPGPDAGIELWWARNIGVYNNTVWREDAAGPGLRGGMSEWKIEGIRVVNNLVRGTNLLDGDVFQESNLFGDLAGCSLDWSRLVFFCGPEVAGMQGKSLEEVQDDFNGKPRGRTPDIGAFERAEGR